MIAWLGDAITAIGWRVAAVAIAALAAGGWMLWQARQIDGLRGDLAACAAASAAADIEAALRLGEYQRRASSLAGVVASSEAEIRRSHTVIREATHADDDAPLAPALRHALDRLRAARAAGAADLADGAGQPAGDP